MSTNATATNTPPVSKQTAKKSKRRERKGQAAGNERLKVVVRRLPPNLPEEVFWNSAEPWVTERTTSWRMFYPGKLRLRSNKENISSRAYIAFTTEANLAAFSREYDGHVFRDKTGAESIAVVEFAPYQKVPSDKKKEDSRKGTIEQDEDYLSFMESLKAEPSKPSNIDGIEALVAATMPPPMPTTTPLLEALKAEKAAQRDKEAILRNHAHYRDLASGSKARPSAPDSTAKGGPKKDKGKGKEKSGKDGAKKEKEQSVSGEKGERKPKKTQQKAQKIQPTAIMTAPKPSAQEPATGAQTTKAPIQQTPTAPPAKAAGAPASKPGQPSSGKGGRRRQASDTIQASAAPAEKPSAPAALEQAQPTGPAASTAAPANEGGGGSGRKARPMVSLASRQLEAALSGAGLRGSRGRGGGGQAQSSAMGATPSPGGQQATQTATDAATPVGQVQEEAHPPSEAPAGRGRRGRGHGRGRGRGRGQGGA